MAQYESLASVNTLPVPCLCQVSVPRTLRHFARTFLVARGAWLHAFQRGSGHRSRAMLWVRGRSSPLPCTSRSGSGMLTTHLCVPCLPQGRKVAAKCFEQLAKVQDRPLCPYQPGCPARWAHTHSAVSVVAVVLDHALVLKLLDLSQSHHGLEVVRSTCMPG